MAPEQVEADRTRTARRAVIGVVGTLCLGIVDPLCGFMVMTPWTGWDFHDWVRAIIIAPLLAFGVNLPLAVGLRSQPSWYSLYLRFLGWPLLIAWAVLLPFSTLYSLSIVQLHASADARVFAGVGFVGLVLGTIPAGFLIYAFRHPYWRRTSVATPAGPGTGRIAAPHRKRSNQATRPRSGRR